MERTLFKVGVDSYAVTIPKAWVSSKQLKHGDVVDVVVGEEVIIRTKQEPDDTAELQC